MTRLIVRAIIIIVLGFALFLGTTNDNLGVIYKALITVAFFGQFILLYENCKTYLRQKDDKKNI